MKLKQFKKEKLTKKQRLPIIIVGCFCLIFLLIAIYQSFAAYNIKHSERIVDAKVGSMYDIRILAIYIDNKSQPNMTEFPADKTFSHVECFVNGEYREDIIGTWENDALRIRGFTAKTDCNVYFVSFIIDLDTNMIPIMWHNNGWVKANVNNTGTHSWYDYDNFRWANAVLVSNPSVHRNNAVGTPVPEADILAYFVYIPRYRYQLWNAENGTSQPQMINVEFQRKTDTKSTGSTNGTWLTHPAFTFGTAELNGIWVGKFTTTGTGANPRIKPTQNILINQNVSTPFATAKRFETNPEFGINTNNSINSHMMKNMEWGAAAYLSMSKYGKWNNSAYTAGDARQVWKNNNTNYVTGCSGGSPTAEGTDQGANNCTNIYSSAIGIGASTTGTIYGIYDMNGGTIEAVMGVMDNSNNTPFQISQSGFTSAPNQKYWDRYAYGTTFNNAAAFARGRLGDATRETLSGTGGSLSSWFGNASDFTDLERSFFFRGGVARWAGTTTGLFAYSRTMGAILVSNDMGLRSVLVFE